MKNQTHRNVPPALFAVEPLEPRTLLAAVAWTGAGGNSLWHNPGNWSTNSVPTADDDVVIQVAANPTIIFNAATGPRSVKSLVLDEALTLSGGSLAVVGVAKASSQVTLNGGTLSGGVWDVAALGMTVGATQSTLADVQVLGNLNFTSFISKALLSGSTRFGTANLSAGAATIIFAGGYVLSDALVVSGIAIGPRAISIAGAGTLTIGATGSVRIAAGSGDGVTFDPGAGKTLINYGLIASEGGGRTISVATPSFENRGSIRATGGGIVSVTGASWSNFGSIQGSRSTQLTLGGTAWTNAGSIECSDSTQVSFGGAWSSPGTVSFSGGTITLGGTFTTADWNLPGWVRSGGTLKLTGALNNLASSVTLDDATGSLQIAGGTISAGSITLLGTARLEFTASGAMVSNTLIAGDLWVSAAAYVTVSGSTRFAAAHLMGDQAQIQLTAGYVLRDIVLAEGVSEGDRVVRMITGGTVTVAPTGVLRVLPSCGGGLSVFNEVAGTLINQGLIASESPSHTLLLGADRFTNSGEIKAISGTVHILSGFLWTNQGSIVATDGGVITLERSWTNTGLISITDSTLNLYGSFATSSVSPARLFRSGGTVNLFGALGNANATFTLNASTGSWNVQQGQITGGTLVFADGQSLRFPDSYGTLFNVQLVSDLYLFGPHEGVILTGATRVRSIHLAGADTSLGFLNGYNLHDPVYAEGAGTGQRTISGSGTGIAIIAADALIRMDASCGGNLSITSDSLKNYGVIENMSATKTLSIGGTSFSNYGTIAAPNGGGLLVGNSGFVNEGTVRVGLAGTLTLSGSLNKGTIEAGLGSNVLLAGFAWTNTGTMKFQQCTITLDQNCTGAALSQPSLSLAGSTVLLTGFLDNTGSVLNLGTSSGSWRVRGGLITGGSINLTDGQSMGVDAPGLAGRQPTFTDVVINGEVFLDQRGSALGLVGTAQVSSLHLRGVNSFVSVRPGYVLKGSVIGDGTEPGDRQIIVVLNGTMTVAPTGSIIMAGGDGVFMHVVAASVTNQGLVASYFPSNSLTFTVDSLTNNGEFRASGSRIAGQFSTVLTNISLPTRTLIGGVWTVEKGGVLDFSGSVRTNAAVLNISGPGSSFGSLVNMSANTGSLSITEDAILNLTPSGGTFVNSGSVSVLSGGLLRITGQLSQTASGSMSLGITGASRYGRISSTGQASLDGVLSISYAGYVLHRGDVFDFISASAVTGVFAHQDVGHIEGFERPWLRYQPGKVRLEILSAADFDGDGFTTGEDFDNYLIAFQNGDLSADLDGDGFVTSDDCDLFLSSFVHG